MIAKLEKYTDLAIGYGTEYGIKILGSLLIFLIGRWISRRIVALIKKGMLKADVDETLISFVGNGTYVALIIVIVIASIGNLGVETISFVAVFGAVGLAAGLALKDTLSNVGAAVLIIFFEPFKVGDSIETAGAIGTVKAINLFSTTLTTADNRSIIIPNGALIGGNIINNTENSTRRIDMLFLIDYKDDLGVVRQAVTTVLENNARVLKSPAYIVAVETLGRDGVHLVVQPWVKVDEYADVKFEVTEAIKNEFDKYNIAIATSPVDLHRLA